MSKVHPVTIEISKGTITCKERGGHVHAARADQIAWTGKNVQFTLIFKDFDIGAPTWPFTIPEPPPAFWPCGDFNATLKDLGIYKYTVQIRGYPDLDPIIIVDK